MVSSGLEELVLAEVGRERERQRERVPTYSPSLHCQITCTYCTCSLKSYKIKGKTLTTIARESAAVSLDKAQLVVTTHSTVGENRALFRVIM